MNPILPTKPRQRAWALQEFRTLLLSLLLAACCPPIARAEPLPRIAILGAFEEEVLSLLAEVEEARAETVQGLRFVCGTLRGQNVVVGMTGVGKVNAALATGLLLERFEPNAVLFTGVSGSLNPNLLPGDVVVGATTVQHDLGAWDEDGLRRYGIRNPVTGRRNPTGFSANPSLLEVARQAAKEIHLAPVSIDGASTEPKVLFGTIVSGDVFVASKEKKRELVQNLDADAVEMEGAAVAQVCWQLGFPCLVIRSVSDRADSNAEDEFEIYYQTAARNAARLVLGLLENLPREPSESLDQH